MAGPNNPLSPLPNQQLNLTHFTTRKPLLSLPSFSFSLSLIDIPDFSLSPFQFSLHLPKELNPMSFLFVPQLTFPTYFPLLSGVHHSSQITLLFYIHLMLSYYHVCSCYWLLKYYSFLYFQRFKFFPPLSQTWFKCLPWFPSWERERDWKWSLSPLNTYMLLLFKTLI